jgi:hypothetical protein
MPTTHRIHHLAVAGALAFALLAGPAAASPPAADPAAATTAVPPSQYNARWPREPAGGPQPAVRPQPTVAPPRTPTGGREWTLAPVAAGILMLAAFAAFASGVRPRTRRRAVA